MAFLTTDEKSAFRRFFLLAPPILLNFPGLLLGTYLAIYATDVLLVAPAALGTILLLTRIFDGITDPIVAVWSDRRRGLRRVPIILAGALFLPAIAFLWLPPESLSGLSLLLWIAAFYILFEVGQTMRSIPTYSLGLEVARTSRQRIFVKLVFGVCSFVAYIGSLFLMQYLTDHENPREAITPIIIGFTAAHFVVYMGVVMLLKELPQQQRSEERPIVVMFKEVLANRYHRQFLGIQTAEVVAMACIGFAVPYVMKYVLDRPDLTMYVFLTNGVAATLAAFVWWRLVPRLGVRKCWLIGQYCWVAVLAGWLLVPVLGVWFFLFLAFLSGIGGAGGNCVSYAMLGDIADFDAQESGRQRQGIYITIYGLVSRIALAIVAFVLGWILQLSGFEPNVEQDRGFFVGITLIVSVLPLIGIFWSIRLLHRYRLYEEQGIEDGRGWSAKMSVASA